MKKMLKKIGVLVLTIAALTPFIDIPIVKAAETCTKHLQNYLFLDKNWLNPYGAETNGHDNFLENYKDGGYQTYTLFPFVFDVNENSGVEYRVKNVNLNQIKSTQALQNYYTFHNGIIQHALEDRTYYNNPDKQGSVFVTQAKLSGYDTNTILLHGRWARSTAAGTPIVNAWTTLLDNYSSASAENYWRPLQSVFTKSTNHLDNLDAVISSATFVNETFDSISDTFNASYLKNLMENYEQAESDNKLYIEDENMYLPISITRKINNTAFLADYNVGYTVTDPTTGNVTLFVYSSTQPEYTSGTLNNVTASYNQFKAYGDYLESLANDGDRAAANCANAGGNKYCYEVDTSSLSGFSDATFKATPQNYGIDLIPGAVYYWPFVMSVEYEACTGEVINEGEWTLKYHGNKDGVSNLPKGGDYALGKKVTVGKAPTLKDNTFKEWNTKPDGSGEKYAPGDTITRNSEGTTNLYAIWGDTTKGSQVPGGIYSYVIGFISVGILAGGIYLVSKKNNFFKQI